MINQNVPLIVFLFNKLKVLINHLLYDFEKPTDLVPSLEENLHGFKISSYFLEYEDYIYGGKPCGGD